LGHRTISHQTGGDADPLFDKEADSIIEPATEPV
jgi:hypothetical protein